MLQSIKGGSCDIKNVMDQFHTNLLLSFSFIVLILGEKRDKKDNESRVIQAKMYRIRKTNDEPEFFKNCVEL